MVIFLMLMFPCHAQDIRRGRNEGTVNIPASNVDGNGNITLSATLNGSIGKHSSMLKSKIAGKIGIADILQGFVSTSVVNFRKIGLTEVHGQITLPQNDGLRFFGIAFCGDLFLSTAMDTISGEAISGRPDFHSYIRPSLICDQDWIAIDKKVSLKTYQLFSMADDADRLFQYDQLSFKLGAEWKTYHHSYFVDASVGMYKEKKTTAFSGDKGFKQQKVWLEPGVRLRLRNRFSFLASMRFLLLQRVKTERPLSPQYVSMQLTFEAPVCFRETNTEAIRTLIFIDNAKDKEKDRITRSIEQGKSIKTDFETGFEDLAPEKSDIDQQKEALRKREEIQNKMEEIEKLLEDLE
ncbi:MAG: hypothetical protein GX267_03640 [Fibrobacter sp.]|nr:hypothetical protein [Fibrobacter sp.]